MEEAVGRAGVSAQKGGESEVINRAIRHVRLLQQRLRGGEEGGLVLGCKFPTEIPHSYPLTPLLHGSVAPHLPPPNHTLCRTTPALLIPPPETMSVVCV